jgi:hypothetical protein
VIVLRCSAKLLKRLRQPGKLPEPVGASDNPLGEWLADIDFIDRQPFVLVMNAATGLVLVLPARAADLRRLHEMVGEQLGALLDVLGIDGALAEAELDAWREPACFARTTDRSLVASMNQRRHEAWTQFAYNRLTAFEVALRLLDTPFKRKDLGKDYHRTIDLLQARLRPSAKIIPMRGSGAVH